MKLAFLALHSSPAGRLGERFVGGMSVVVGQWSAGLGRRGHRVDVFTATGPGNVESFPEGGCHLHRIGPTGTTDPLSLARAAGPLADEIEEIAADRCYDAVFSHYWVSALAGERLATRWGVPHLVMFHTLARAKNASAQAESEPIARIAAEDRLARSAQQVVVSCPREAGNLSAHHHAGSAVVPLGVDLGRFRPLGRGPCRNILGWPEHTPTVLFVGRPAPEKGLDRLVAAVVRLRRRRPVELVVVGDASDLPWLPPWVRAVHTVPQEDLPLVYGAADVVVVPSWYESFGLVTLEALACGRPAVTTRVGVADEVVVDGRNGTIIDDPAPAPFADALDTWLASRPSPAALRHTVLPWTWDRSVDRLEVALKELVAKRPQKVGSPNQRG